MLADDLQIVQFRASASRARDDVVNVHQVVESGQRLLAERARARVLARARDHLPPRLRRHGLRNGRRPWEHFLDGRLS